MQSGGSGDRARLLALAWLAHLLMIEDAEFAASVFDDESGLTGWKPQVYGDGQHFFGSPPGPPTASLLWGSMRVAQVIRFTKGLYRNLTFFGFLSAGVFGCGGDFGDGAGGLFGGFFGESEGGLAQVFGDAGHLDAEDDGVALVDRLAL